MTLTLRTVALLAACCHGAALPSTAAGQGAQVGVGSTSAVAPAVSSSSSSSGDAAEVDSTSIYRVGPGDILDIRLLNAPRAAARRSTLYVVAADGTLDYPLAGKSRKAAGLTTEEIAAQLAASFRLRSLFPAPPRVHITVREYASHAIEVGGLVADPGVKIIQREAVPLYVLIADAQPRKAAGRAVVNCRLSGARQTFNLADAASLKALVHPGDTVTLEEVPPQFFRVEGLVREPGRKTLQAGMTLTQALLLAGGAREDKGGGGDDAALKELARSLAAEGLRGRERKELKAVVERRGEGGQLKRVVYVLGEIEGGRVADPVLREDDRVVVLR